MNMPKNVHDLQGPLYTLTHPKTTTLDLYRPLLMSCFEGEHGDLGKALAFAMADHVGVHVPPIYTRPVGIVLTFHRQSGKLEDK